MLDAPLPEHIRKHKRRGAAVPKHAEVAPRFDSQIAEALDNWTDPRKRGVTIGLFWRRKQEKGEIYPGHSEYLHAVQRAKLAEGVPEPLWRIKTRKENARQDKLRERTYSRLIGPGQPKKQMGRPATSEKPASIRRRQRYAKEKTSR